MTTVAGPRVARTLEEVAGGWAGRRVVGVEREYGVERDGAPVDARVLLPAVADLGRALDPGDARARRGPWGGAVTADGRHAEVATPPVALGPGCTHHVLGLAAAGAAHLRGRLPTGHTLVGYSTHLSVEVPDRHVVPVARLVARRLALPLMLLLDRVDSPGLLVRPRPGRLEIGGEFAAGEQLRAAMALAVGITLLAERRCHLAGRLTLIASARPARTERAVERFGWYVDRRAFGPDLYQGGRATLLGRATAGAALARTWRAARPFAAQVLADDEVALVDAAVAGRAPLPLEHATDDDGAPAPVRTDRDYGPRQRGDLAVRVAAATWWKALLEVDDGGRRRWVTIPGRALDDVLDALDDGALDSDLRRLVLPAGSDG